MSQSGGFVCRGISDRNVIYFICVGVLIPGEYLKVLIFSTFRYSKWCFFYVSITTVIISYFNVWIQRFLFWRNITWMNHWLCSIQRNSVEVEWPETAISLELTLLSYRLFFSSLCFIFPWKCHSKAFYSIESLLIEKAVSFLKWNCFIHKNRRPHRTKVHFSIFGDIIVED